MILNVYYDITEKINLKKDGGWIKLKFSARQAKALERAFDWCIVWPLLDLTGSSL